MSFWLREIVGWFLVALGLWFMFDCYVMLKEYRVWEVSLQSIIAIMVFRGGIHLLKVAVAARICREARERTRAHKPAPARPAARPLPGVTPPVATRVP
jgi:hypothetical protein